MRQNPYKNRVQVSQSIANKTIKGDNFQVGILPNMGPNASREMNSLLAYGSGLGSVAIDSSLVVTKAQRDRRYMDE